MIKEKKIAWQYPAHHRGPEELWLSISKYVQRRLRQATMWLGRKLCLSEKRRARTLTYLFWLQTRELWKPPLSQMCQRFYSLPWMLLFVTRIPMWGWQQQYANMPYSHIILWHRMWCTLPFWRVSNHLERRDKERVSHHQLSQPFPLHCHAVMSAVLGLRLC